MPTLPKKILIATNNQGKFKEISELLRAINIESVKIADDLREPVETGVDFAANALLKAKYYAATKNMIALADDSGLCIDALDGAPGVHSARFSLDENGKKNFVHAFKKILDALVKKGLNPLGCSAHFICNLAIFDPATNFSTQFEGRVDGTLTFPARGNKGFGYDPIFIKNGMTQTFGEIDSRQKDQISHRFIAFEKLLKYYL